VKKTLLHQLRCPFCWGRLEESCTDGDVNELRHGILKCHCGNYPVVAGIPIFQKDNTLVSEILSLVEKRLNKDALALAISPFGIAPPKTPELAPSWVRALPSVKGINRVKHIAHVGHLRDWKRRAADLLNRNGSGTVTEFDAFFFRYNAEAFNYFVFRPGQPRHLVALSLASIIQNPARPILDLACGQGHIVRNLLRRAGAQGVVGADPNFMGLYVAKMFIAPQADYVCCATDGPLPFPDGFFSTAFCSDAFHYFVKKAATIRELKRLTREDGLIILTWVHNAHIRVAHDGLPLPPEAYEALVDDIPHRLIADREVLARYRQKRGPALATAHDVDDLTDAPVLSILASHRTDVFKDYGSFEEWPHGQGHLSLNPLYEIGRVPHRDEIELLRRFPSDFYATDHAESKEYLPQSVKIPSQVLEDLNHNKRTADIDALIDRCVVLDVPERYR
jgi:SAM-dependent methyltransferase/uncharacterized protein YbaR (Trm112 family)